MIWRSVVGKLWATIIGLACVVLVILGVLLLQFLDRYFYEKQSNDLKHLAEQLVALVVESPARQDVIRVARAVVEAHDTRLVVIGLDSGEKPKRVLLDDRPSAASDVPEVPLDALLRHTALQEVLKGKEVVVRGRFPLVGAGGKSGRALFEQEIVAVGEPVPLGSGTYGAFILYRTLEDVETTMTHVRRLLLYAAGICIVLTTFFAFFLSTRITEPLRLMKKAADRMARGAFDSRVPIRTRDEIGDLARTFNRLAQQLDETIHALQREKEQLASILRSMADGVITVDRDGRVVVTNPPAERILRAWQEGDGAALPAPLAALFQRVMRERRELATDLPVQGRIWSVVMAPLYDRDDVRGAVAVLRDMTEERRLDKLRKDFIANVSHELRTPLAMLQGYSEAMVDDIAATPEERKEMARVIYEETRRMGRLVNDLLDLARMEAGSFQLDRQEIDPVAWTDRLLRKFSALAREQGIALKAEAVGEIGPLRVDPDRLEQILTNLLDNAFRYTPPGGTIRVRLRDEGGGVWIEVADTGVGIPEEDLPFIFERFYKADKARTRGQAGTGLGLAIVKSLVEAHGGSITVSSKVGEGTRFTMFFPRTDAGDVAGQAPKTRPSRDTGRGPA